MEGNTKKVAIIGYGFVGKATERLLGLLDTTFDIQIEDPDKDYVIEDWNGIQYAFICVPTNLKDGILDNSIIDNILSNLYVGVIPVIRSTVGPDQCIEYSKKGCIIMPEFLREKHWEEDVDDPNIDIIIGHRNYDDFVDLMSCGPKFVKPVTYSVVKHGIIGLTKYTASYWAKKNIRCNAIAPGGIFNHQNKKFVNKINKLIPLGRMAEINEYNDLILFLCSKASSYITGSVVVADGGRTII